MEQTIFIKVKRSSLCMVILGFCVILSEATLVKGKVLNVKIGGEVEQLDSRKIWDNGTYNAFTDLIRFNGRWFCSFREGVKHNKEVGAVRIIESLDGDHWETAEVFRGEIGVKKLGIEPIDRFTGVDLRDPKLSVTPDGRLMVVMGGAVLVNGVIVERNSKVSFSSDGRNWSELVDILEPGRWLWRVSWHKGVAYGYAYEIDLVSGKRSGYLLRSKNGLDWDYIDELDIPYASEATIRFLEDDTMIVLARTRPPSSKDRVSRIGKSLPPYKTWSWDEVPYKLGGPNFIVLPNGKFIAGSRFSGGAEEDWDKDPVTAIYEMSLDSLKPVAVFESGGDTSYPGMVWHDGELWITYYSSHHGDAKIYLSRLKLSW